ncbi:MAG: hypothetical protein O3B43_01705 [Chloroflexi bacterium]|nr:hypothetical protein [Chloroflexota bacterium]
MKLDPTNRFVLRSASRLFAHLDDPERANILLSKSSGVLSDPWLTAAEIATAGLAGRRSQNIKSGLRLVNSGKFSSLAISELASAVATEELFSGATAKSRKLFKQSLIHPTDNTVAQAEWAKSRFPNFAINNDVFEVPRAFEANALREYHVGNWEEALTHITDWHRDEPFSSQPAIMGSYLASIALEDYEFAASIAREGRKANKEDKTLANNLAFALINQNKLKLAEEVLGEVSRPAEDIQEEVALLATEGLLEFRKGNIERGTFLYHAAIEKSELHSLDTMTALADLFLAKEQINVGIFNHKSLDKISGEVNKLGGRPELVLFLNKIIDDLDNNKQ